MNNSTLLVVKENPMAGMECAEECVPLGKRKPHLLWSRT